MNFFLNFFLNFKSNLPSSLCQCIIDLNINQACKTTLILNRNANQLVCHSAYKILVWDITKMCIIHDFMHTDALTSVVLMPNSNTLAMCSLSDSAIFLWHTDQSNEPTQHLLGHRFYILSLSLVDATQELISRDNYHVKVWDTRRRLCLKTFRINFKILDVFNTDTGHFYYRTSSGESSMIKIWSLSGQKSPSLPPYFYSKHMICARGLEVPVLRGCRGFVRNREPCENACDAISRMRHNARLIREWYALGYILLFVALMLCIVLTLLFTNS